MNTNNVAVIICNYNYSDYVLQSIKSALSQSFEPTVYFIDDGSIDDSWEKVLKEYGGISYNVTGAKQYEYFNFRNLHAYRIENSGASNARNFLIDFAIKDNDYITILDSDDFMMENKVDRMLDIINKYDEIGAVYADYIINKPVYTCQEYKEPYSLAGLYRSCIVHSGAMIKSKYLKMVKLENGEYYKTCLHGPASKEFIGCTEDYDLWFRLSKVCMFAHVPEVLTIVNEHGRNQSAKMNQQIFQDNIRKMNV